MCNFFWKEFSFFDLAQFFAFVFSFLSFYYIIFVNDGVCICARPFERFEQFNKVQFNTKDSFSLRNLIELIIKYNFMFLSLSVFFSFTPFLLSLYHRAKPGGCRALWFDLCATIFLSVLSFICWIFHSIKWSNGNMHQIKFDLSYTHLM